MKIYKITLSLLVFASLFSCTKKLDNPANPETPITSLAQLVVADDFTWQAGLTGQINLSFNNPNKVSTEFEIINIVNEQGQVITRNRIINGEVSFNIELPQNSKYYIHFPVTEEQFEITEIKDMVLNLGPTSSFKSSTAINEDIENCTTCDNPMENSGAEAPAINSGYSIVHQDNVPGWETNAVDHKIEIWKDGFNGVPSQEGNQFFELNANRVADLYQELCLNPGSSIVWSVWHRGRAGVDVAEVKIGGSVESAITLTEMSDGTDAWGHYMGTYTVPEGQETTFFVFSSVSSAGSNSVGNFLDNFEIECDFDGDGIPDSEDDDPGNPDVAYVSYFPTSGKQIIAFEDLWPSLGDFDFNDLTMSNQIMISKGETFDILFADFKVSIDAIGAGIHNGIGMMFYDEEGNAFPNEIITSVSGDVSIDPDNNNGLILSDDVYSSIEEYYQNNGVGPTNENPDTLFFTVTFTTGIQDFTPELYIFRSNDRSHEVHRSIFPGTAVADPNLFNTSDDNGNYQTANGIPWGIEIIMEGEYSSPIEKIEISDAYPQFLPWAQSGGTQNTNWYESPVSTKVFDITP